MICSQHVVKPSFRGVKPCNLALYRKTHLSVNLYFLGFPVYVFLSVPRSRQTAQKLVVMGSHHHKIPENLREFSPKKSSGFSSIFSLAFFRKLSVIFLIFKPWKKQKIFLSFSTHHNLLFSPHRFSTICTMFSPNSAKSRDFLVFHCGKHLKTRQLYVKI